MFCRSDSRFENREDAESTVSLSDEGLEIGFAKAYDKFVFDKNKTGSYLPLIEIKSQGNNYPGSKQIRLDTYVGSNSHGSQAEAINILPAIVGASLVGV